MEIYKNIDELIGKWIGRACRLEKKADGPGQGDEISWEKAQVYRKCVDELFKIYRKVMK